jgi:uncharacterized membrane protein
MSKTIRILIISSLILNVLLIGIIIGSMSDRLFRKDFPRRKPPELGLKLPPDKKKLFLDTMEKVFRENDDIRKQMDEARERVLSILSAPEFDEAAYQVETAKLEKLRGMMMQRFADATKELAKRFNQEERKALAEHLRQPPPPSPPPYSGGPPFKGGPPLPPEGPSSRRMP